MNTTTVTNDVDLIKINTLQLVELLNKVEKSTIINMVTETTVRMNKTGNKFYNLVKKISNQNVIIGNTYENRVNNNLEREDKDRNFEVSKNNVGEHFSKVVLYNENTKKFYLQYERFNEVKPKVFYSFNDNEIDYNLFKDYIVKSSNYSNQNLDNTVKVMSVTLNNIKELSMFGKKYIITE